MVKQPPKGNKSIGHDAVIVRGQPDMVVRLAKCCNPLPGDEIIGYVTRGRGVSVHRADCSNINDVDFEPARRIEVAWGLSLIHISRHIFRGRMRLLPPTPLAAFPPAWIIPQPENARQI